MAEPEQVVVDFWEQFNSDEAFVEVECEGTYNNLAFGVLDYYQIPMAAGVSSIGGKLENIDIKHTDALSVIKMSLIEQSAKDGTFYEPIVNEEGEVEFKEIGASTADLNDIYHQMQTFTYVEKCNGVMIQGGAELPTRKAVEWKPIWGSEPDDKQIFDTDIMHTNCLKDNFSNYAVIAFRDPHISTQGGSQYEDGIDNLYEITSDNPWDKILGYAYFLNVPPEPISTPETSVTLTNTCSIPIRIGYNGEDEPPSLHAAGSTLQRHPVYTEIVDGNPVDDPSCWAGLGQTANYLDGIEIPIPDRFRFEDIRGNKIDNYDGVSEIIVIGLPIDTGIGVPVTAADAIQTDDALVSTTLVLTPESTSTMAFKLSEGDHYVIAYEERDGFKYPYVIFANNSRTNDPAEFGNSVSFKWDTSSEIYMTNQGEQVESILPISSDGKCILVKDIWARVNLNTPSIVIYDPSGITEDGSSRAYTIAENLDFLVTPIVVEEPPAPLAFNGVAINQVNSIQDHDPTTVQNFEDTEYELVIDQMEGGGFSLTMNSLDEAACIKLSETLYSFMNSGDGIATVYTCGPTTEVFLGDVGPAGGIINNITYNYTDSSSYTIGVTEGPRIVGGLTDITGAPSPKAAEEVSANGTIIQDMGNNIYYKVRIDGYGERIAINTAGKILRVGDKVSCSVHNNPVEA